MINIIDGDILQAKEGIICHQVNCKGVMGSGLAKQIKEKYPEAYKEYLALCTKYTHYEPLGSVQFVNCHDGKIIANIFGQRNYGRGSKQTDYDALEHGLLQLYDLSKQEGLTVAIPFNIGCGLAGGSWPFVYSMIEEVFQDCDVILYRFNK